MSDADCETVVDALERLVAVFDGHMPGNRALQPLVDARAALARLRDVVPTTVGGADG